jgi:ribosomal protein S27E
MSGKLEPEEVPCTHELVLFNRTTFHVSCADCKELLAEPPAAKATAVQAPCPHLMVTTDSGTNLTSCLVCKKTLTKETYVDWTGEVKGTVDDEANMRALPKYLFDPSFQGAHSGGVASYSYEEAYKGDVNSNWDPASGNACPHYLKTTNVKTGKVTCSMCNQEVSG